MTSDKMPELLHVAVNVDENVPCDFVAHETQIFTYMSQPYIRADLCSKPDWGKLQAEISAACDTPDFDAAWVIEVIKEHLKMTEER